MKSFWKRIRAWRRAVRERRRAFSLLDELFRTPDLLRGTSLSRRHAARWVYLRHRLDDDGHIREVDFGIVRHPRPYAFSQQSHKVAEYYTYDVSAGVVHRHRGVNITRAQGRDDD